VEALSLGERDHYPHRKETYKVLARPKHDATSEALQMDGIKKYISLFIKYNKGATNKLAGMLSRPPLNKIAC